MNGSRLIRFLIKSTFQISDKSTFHRFLWDVCFVRFLTKQKLYPHCTPGSTPGGLSDPAPL